MHLALTRTARSADLSKLDIRAYSFTAAAAGATLKALHLSKQSRASKQASGRLLLSTISRGGGDLSSIYITGV